jgi:lactate dehydrogenase-like 2-hydroxyacid dehydrogenase
VRTGKWHDPRPTELLDWQLTGKNLGIYGMGRIGRARGSLVDDDASIRGLRAGRIAAAGFDVYNREPHVRPEYRVLPSVFLLPHLGTGTIETRTQMGMRGLDNVDAALAGKTPRDLLTGAAASSR